MKSEYALVRIKSALDYLETRTLGVASSFKLKVFVSQVFLKIRQLP